MEMKFYILVFCAFLQLGAVFSHPEREADESAELNLQQQQQEREDEGLIEFQRNINQRPAIIRGRNQIKQDTDVCLEPRRTGRCKAHIPRYYFNTEAGECQRFTYGGCGGNENNFEDLAACEAKCSSHLKKALKPEDVNGDEICAQPPFDAAKSTSNCRAYLPRWYYNATQETCIQFIYRGCGATPNLYHNRLSCQEKCGHYRISKVTEGDDKSQDLIVASHTKSKVCDLELSKGFCYGNTNRFYFNKENGRCQAFSYGGCGGNDNNFQTEDECVRSCGGTTPSYNPECAGVRCPWNLYTHYTTMDCKPIYDGQSCCPTRFNCPSDLNQTTTKNVPTCKYNGIIYKVGEQVTEASSNSACRASCTCYASGDQARINCASIECPENLGVIPPGKRSCKRLYKKGECCADGFHCPNETTTVKPYTCSYEGKTYVEGEKIFPSTAKCQTCLCQRGFNGTLNKEFCENIDCGIEIYYSDQLNRGCSPVYFRSADGNEGCCPIGWECPDEQDFTPPPPSSKLPVQPRSDPVPIPSRTVTADVCTLNRDAGPCRASRMRHFYNSTSKKCEKFIYGGCDGNENNFVVLKDCQNVCESRPTENLNTERDRNPINRAGLVPTLPSKTYDLTELDACTQPPKTGACKGFFQRYYFSPEENRCKQFTYGGCRGNKNNFFSLEGCQAVCQNIVPTSNSLTRINLNNDDTIDNTGDSSRVNFDDQRPLPDLSHLTVTDITNRSLPEGTVEIDVEDPCIPKPETGRCKGHIRRYYFDTDTQLCKQFVYGGCGGNRNNFERIKECEFRCAPSKGQGSPGARVQIRWRSMGTPETGAPKPEEPTQSVYGGYTERCNLPVQVGSCKATVKAFYFNAETQTCQNFTYSGCFGNANRFPSVVACEDACKNKDLGDTTTPNPVFSRSGSIPSGSRTSGATPDERRERPEKLSVEDEVLADKGFCASPVTPGNCRGHNLRFYFDADLKQCLPFVYTGCRGNKNNFLTESDCISACSSESTIEKITQEGVLTCSFGNETIPIGGKLGGLSGTDEPCGVPLCQCLTPPSLTCVQVQCPPPQPSPPPCPSPSCGPHCKPSIRPDNGCPTCDCEGGPEFQQVEFITPTAVKCEGAGCPGVKNVKG